MHILNFQRDLIVGWIIHIELNRRLYNVEANTGPKKNNQYN